MNTRSKRNLLVVWLTLVFLAMARQCFFSAQTTMPSDASVSLAAFEETIPVNQVTIEMNSPQLDPNRSIYRLVEKSGSSYQQVEPHPLFILASAEQNTEVVVYDAEPLGNTVAINSEIKTAVAIPAAQISKSGEGNSRQFVIENKAMVSEQVMVSENNNAKLTANTDAKTKVAVVDVNSTGVNLALPSLDDEPTVRGREKQQQEPPYQDQLIDPTTAALDEYPLENAAATLLPNWLPGNADVEVRYIYNKTSSGNSESVRRDRGVSLLLQQETLDYGQFYLQATATQDNGAENSGFLLRQKSFALNERVLMENAIGQQHLFYPALLLSSQRHRLPLPIIDGVSSQIQSGSVNAQMVLGKLGSQSGRTFPVFKPTQGTVAGLSATTRFNQHWQGGALLWQINNAYGTNNTLSDHQSFLGAVKYDNPLERYVGQLHLLANAGGKQGVWLDSRKIVSGWLHQFGVFRADDGLRWIDRSAPVSANRSGLYWQAGFNRSRYSFGFGLDADRALSAPDNSHKQLFSYGHYQFSLQTHGHGRLALTEDESSTAQQKKQLLNLSTGLGHKFSFGRSSWLGSYTKSLGTADVEDIQLVWDHDPGAFINMQSGLGLVFDRQSRSGQQTNQTTLKASVSKNFQDFIVGARAAMGYNDGPVYSGRNSSINAHVNWFINQYFFLNLDLNWEKNRLETSGFDSQLTSNYLLLSLKYNQDWGQRKTVYAGAEVCNGFGTVKGVVFIDGNNNGIRELSETGVADVTVNLDSVYSVRTDADGEYLFSPVTCGKHAVSLTISDVPLPWGLADEEPIIVVVKPRSQDTVNFDLHDISWVDLNAQ